MPTMKIAFQALLSTGFLLTCARGIQAQQPTAYVSGGGSDSGSCVRSAPCKTFLYAYNKGASEIVALDSGEYGPLTISRSLTIIAQGAAAEIYPAAYAASLPYPERSAIYVDTAAGTVVLRGLTIRGNNSRLYGIEVKAAAALYVEDCAIDGFTGPGIASAPYDDLSIPSISIKNTTVRNCDTGVLVRNNSTTYRALFSIDGCRFEGNKQTGVTTNGNVRGVVRETTAAKNAHGFKAESGSQIVLEGCLAWGNGNGVYIISNSTIYVSNTTATNNNVGLNGYSGVIYTYRNNMLQGNVTGATAGTVTTTSQG